MGKFENIYKNFNINNLILFLTEESPNLNERYKEFIEISNLEKIKKLDQERDNNFNLVKKQIALELRNCNGSDYEKLSERILDIITDFAGNQELIIYEASFLLYRNFIKQLID